MRLVLDTHVLIWWDLGKPLRARACRAIQDADQVFVSARDRVFRRYGVRTLAA